MPWLLLHLIRSSVPARFQPCRTSEPCPACPERPVPSAVEGRRRELAEGSGSDHPLLNEKNIGSFEVGKLADFIVIDKDYFAIPGDSIKTIQT